MAEATSDAQAVLNAIKGKKVGTVWLDVEDTTTLRDTSKKTLTNAVKTCLDELEKAHSNVINLFFQILDEGIISDSKGDVINFKNTIVIMTTNIGFEKNSIGFNNQQKNQKIKDAFGLAFVNRIDSIVCFDYLKEADIINIIKNKIIRLKSKYKDRKIIISKNVISEIVEKINCKEFGARKIDKVIKQEVEDLIISDIMDNKTNINIKTIKEKQLI